jgi:hypothetical protein
MAWSVLAVLWYKYRAQTNDVLLNTPLMSMLVASFGVRLHTWSRCGCGRELGVWELAQAASVVQCIRSLLVHSSCVARMPEID